MSIKITSWNINGIRACIKKGLLDFVQQNDSDVYLFQEIKITEDDLNTILKKHPTFKKYNAYYSCATKRKGYSGVLTLTRKEPQKHTTKTGIQKIDIEGRFVSVEFEKYFLINAYFPHTSRDLSRLKYKMFFNDEFETLVSKLNKTKPVIVGGDLNVAHEEIDLARPKQNIGNPGFTDIERAWFNNFLLNGYVDTYRNLHKNSREYTWWSYMHNARDKNIGWRIDYLITSQDLENAIIESTTLKDVKGSDHCPIQLTLNT